MSKIWTPFRLFRTCFILIAPSPLKRSKLKFNTPLPTAAPPPSPKLLTKTVNFAILWFCNLLSSAPVNTTKKMLIQIQMVLIIRDGLSISLLILTKLKQIDKDSLSNVWPFKRIYGKSSTWRNKWNRKKYIVGRHKPWLKDGIFAVTNISVEFLMYI